MKKIILSFVLIVFCLGLAGIDAYVAAIKTALTARKDALKAAWLITDKTQRRSALKTAWKNFRTVRGQRNCQNNLLSALAAPKINHWRSIKVVLI